MSEILPEVVDLYLRADSYDEDDELDEEDGDDEDEIDLEAEDDEGPPKKKPRA